MTNILGIEIDRNKEICVGHLEAYEPGQISGEINITEKNEFRIVWGISSVPDGPFFEPEENAWRQVFLDTKNPDSYVFIFQLFKMCGCMEWATAMNKNLFDLMAENYLA